MQCVIVQYAVEAANRIKEKIGKQICVIDMYSIKPLNREAVKIAAGTGKVIVAQEHNIYGGLGSMVAQVIAEEVISCKFKILGLRDEFLSMAHAQYLYHEFEIDADGLEKNMMEFI